MSAQQENPPSHLSPAELVELALLDVDVAAARLAKRGWDRPAGIIELAAAALAGVEENPERALRWLTLADRLHAGTSEAAAAAYVAAGAHISYARARLYVRQGNLTAAETALRNAQQGWQSVGDRTALVRSNLGLSQIMAMQGRYDAADGALLQAIATLGRNGAGPASSDDRFQLAVAHRNRATLFGYQEAHRQSLTEFRLADQLLAPLTNSPPPGLTADDIDLERAHLALNRAVALTFLDEPEVAEIELGKAIATFQRLGESLNLARARSNLGGVFLRTGRYAEAMAAYDAAERGMLEGDPEAEESQQAGILLLEYGLTCLVLNLLPEAAARMTQARDLFQRSGQPYELGQAEYLRGLIELRRDDLATSAAALAAAREQFQQIGNVYRLNQTALAAAALAVHEQDRALAAALLAPLLADLDDDVSEDINEPQTWDRLMVAEARLLQCNLSRLQGDLAGALSQIERLRAQPRISDPPQIRWRIDHAEGLLARDAGEPESALKLFQNAVAGIDRLRGMLSVEEVRSFFLDDKANVYGDLILALLQADVPSEEEIAAAFVLIERARARTLLERLVTVAEESTPADAEQEPRQEEIRRRLYWLYNRLFGSSGRGQLDGLHSHEIRRQEAKLQREAWRSPALLRTARPVDVAALRSVLARDEQAVVYYMAGDELLTFIVGHNEIGLVRRLGPAAALASLRMELSFQLGRVEIGAGHVLRHGSRLLARVETVLKRAYQLLLAPIAGRLHGRRLLIVPHGELHRLPFHAFQRPDGSYLLQHYEIAYAPSASIVTHCRRIDGRSMGNWRLAAVGVEDPSIPNARAEVATIARHYAESRIFEAADASRAGLREAARGADILHIATHGLFRGDNPFFSALKLADGWMDVRAIYRLPLRAQLVVLSACDSGIGDVRGGDEIIGLTRGFLGAGARRLIASLWSVNDAAVVELMDHFYRILAQSGSKNVAAALRATQLAAIEAGQHPYFWAPFFVIE